MSNFMPDLFFQAWRFDLLFCEGCFTILLFYRVVLRRLIWVYTVFPNVWFVGQ